MKTNEEITSYEPKNFKENYKAYLVDLLSTNYKAYENKGDAEKEKERIWEQLGGSETAYCDIYIDPDGKENKGFYRDLSNFLNAANSHRKNKLSFEAYETPDEMISVYYNKGKKGEKKYFSLQSDQLGFSAVPWIYFSTKYPLSRYFEMQKNKEAAQFLAEYVLTTRTLGGSFLWPETLWKGYNRSRGCAKIEDRVDLTLLEIKHYFEYRDLDDKKKFKYRRDILFSRYKIPDAQTWFGFFDSFEDYVDFFMFNDFVDKDKQTKEYTPINILTGEAFETDYPGYKKDTLKEIEDEKQLKEMLERVRDMVEKRTKKMEDLINEYKQTNDTKGEKHENILHE